MDYYYVDPNNNNANAGYAGRGIGLLDHPPVTSGAVDTFVPQVQQPPRHLSVRSMQQFLRRHQRRAQRRAARQNPEQLIEHYDGFAGILASIREAGLSIDIEQLPELIEEGVLDDLTEQVAAEADADIDEDDDESYDESHPTLADERNLLSRWVERVPASAQRQPPTGLPQASQVPWLDRPLVQSPEPMDDDENLGDVEMDDQQVEQEQPYYGLQFGQNGQGYGYGDGAFAVPTAGNTAALGWPDHQGANHAGVAAGDQPSQPQQPMDAFDWDHHFYLSTQRLVASNEQQQLQPEDRVYDFDWTSSNNTPREYREAVAQMDDFDWDPHTITAEHHRPVSQQEMLEYFPEFADVLPRACTCDPNNGECTGLCQRT